MPTLSNLHTEKVFEDELCSIVGRASQIRGACGRYPGLAKH